MPKPHEFPSVALTARLHSQSQERTEKLYLGFLSSSGRSVRAGPGKARARALQPRGSAAGREPAPAQPSPLRAHREPTQPSACCHCWRPSPINLTELNRNCARCWRPCRPGSTGTWTSTTTPPPPEPALPALRELEQPAPHGPSPPATCPGTRKKGAQWLGARRGLAPRPASPRAGRRPHCAAAARNGEAAGALVDSGVTALKETGCKFTLKTLF